MICTKTLLLTVALNLIMSAIALQAAPAPVLITALPFNITAPGTYVLSGNLMIPSFQTAININSVKPGNVVLNLNGHTLTGPGNSNVPGIFVTGNPTGSNVTIENGTVAEFSYGIKAETSDSISLSNIHIVNVTFYGNGYVGLVFSGVNSSSIENCAFIAYLPQGGPLDGIQDNQTQTGNRYVNNTFDGYQSKAIVISFANRVVFAQGQFSVPSTK
jgi:hypothetical protein